MHTGWLVHWKFADANEEQGTAEHSTKSIFQRVSSYIHAAWQLLDRLPFRQPARARLAGASELLLDDAIPAFAGMTHLPATQLFAAAVEFTMR
jgi:hypothetical protein